MHPFVKDVYRTAAIAVRPIATGATAVGAPRHLGEAATLRTRLGRVRFADFHELAAMATPLVFQVLFQSSEFQRPHLLVRPPRTAVPCVVIEGAKIPRIQDGNAEATHAATS